MFVARSKLPRGTFTCWQSGDVTGTEDAWIFFIFVEFIISVSLFRAMPVSERVLAMAIVRVSLICFLKFLIRHYNNEILMNV